MGNTDRVKKDFEKWLSTRWMDEGLILVSPVHALMFDVAEHFNELPVSMQFGVRVDYYKEHEIFIGKASIWSNSWWVEYDTSEFDSLEIPEKQKDLTQEEVLEKASEIRDKILKL